MMQQLFCNTDGTYNVMAIASPARGKSSLTQEYLAPFFQPNMETTSNETMETTS